MCILILTINVRITNIRIRMFC